MKKGYFKIMIEKFDKITNNLEGENVLLSVSDSKVLNQIDIDTYKIDLKSLEDVSTEDKNMYTWKECSKSF